MENAAAGLTALERKQDIGRAMKSFMSAFSEGATSLPAMGGTVYWHEDPGVWGFFGWSKRRDGSLRHWNPFGQVPTSFQSHMTVEINPPVEGRDTDLQGVFATDGHGGTWLLHQGRMSIPGKRVTQQEFAALSGLKPLTVRFRDGTSRTYHPVALLDQPSRQIQMDVAAFVALCGTVRAAKSGASPEVRNSVRKAVSWEALFNPERTGNFEVSPRDAITATRRHAEILKALVRELESLGTKVANERVGRYGPDLYTLVDPLVLFEIKADARPSDLFEGVGQLAIYERLMDRKFRKVLVIPKGAAQALLQVVTGLRLTVLEFERPGRRTVFDQAVVREILSGGNG